MPKVKPGKKQSRDSKLPYTKVSKVIAKKANAPLPTGPVKFKAQAFIPSINLQDIHANDHLLTTAEFNKVLARYQKSKNINKKWSRKNSHLKYSTNTVIGDDGKQYLLTYYRNLSPNSPLYSYADQSMKGGVLGFSRSPVRIVLVTPLNQPGSVNWWGAHKVVTDADDLDKEAQAIRALELPYMDNAFTFHDPSQPEKRHIVLTLLPGKNLNALSASNGFAGFNLLSLLRSINSVINTVIHIHRKNYIHADIKRGNVLSTSKLDSKLTDFGMTRSLEDIASDYFHDFGTHVYLPDECVFNYGKERPSFSTDLFALGALIKEIMGWEIVNDGKTENAEKYKINITIPAGTTMKYSDVIDGEFVEERFILETPETKSFIRALWIYDFDKTLDPNTETTFGPTPSLKDLFLFTNRLMNYAVNKTKITTAADSEALLREFYAIAQALGFTPEVMDLISAPGTPTPPPTVPATPSAASSGRGTPSPA